MSRSKPLLLSVASPKAGIGNTAFYVLLLTAMTSFFVGLSTHAVFKSEGLTTVKGMSNRLNSPPGAHLSTGNWQQWPGGHSSGAHSGQWSLARSPQWSSSYHPLIHFTEVLVVAANGNLWVCFLWWQFGRRSPGMLFSKTEGEKWHYTARITRNTQLLVCTCDHALLKQ
jgi:hypothetical protein